MRIEIDDRGSYTVARVIGELDAAEGERFIEKLHEHASGEGARLAVDLSELQSIDSQGLSAMIHLVTRSRRGRGRVVLVAPNPLISGVLSTTRLDTWFEICKTIEEAGKQFTQG